MRRKRQDLRFRVFERDRKQFLNEYGRKWGTDIRLVFNHSTGEFLGIEEFNVERAPKGKVRELCPV